MTVLAGLGPVVTSHMVRLVPPAFAVDDAALPLPAAEPHAASATVIVVAAASVSHLRPLAWLPDLPMAFLRAPQGRFDSFRKLSNERHRKIWRFHGQYQHFRYITRRQICLDHFVAGHKAASSGS